MGRDQGPPFTRHGMMRGFAAALAVLLAGCSGHANVQGNSSNVSSNVSVNIPGRSTVGTLLSLVFLAGVSYDGDRGMPRSAEVPGLAHVPELDPARRVAEQDCTKPIENRSANLRCR